MSLSVGDHPGSKSARPQRSGAPAAIVAVVLFALGVLAVCWRAWSGANTERVHARAEAKGCAAALELQFSKALHAAEVLSAVSRQSGGAATNLLAIATELHVAFPELASLELQPGGVVSDIVPLLGNQRAIGFNVLKDPSYRVGATAALQSGATVAAAPLKLYRGDPGLVVTVPVVQKTRGGQGRFWGFLAVSMALPGAFHHAGLDDLASRGYDYSLSVAAPGSNKSILLAARGVERLADPVAQYFRVQNLEFRLALRRHGGWISVPGTLLEFTAVVLASLLVFAVLNVVMALRETEQALAAARGSLADEAAAREHAQEVLTKSRLTEASEATQLRERLEQAQEELALHLQSLREATEGRQLAEAALKQAQLQTTDLQARLESSKSGEEKNRTTTGVELADTRSQLKEMGEKVQELESALAKAEQSSSAAEARAQAQEARWQAATAELQARLKTQESASAKARAAETVKLEEAEAAAHELSDRLKDMERLQVRVAELEAQLRVAEARPEPPSETITLSSPMDRPSLVKSTGRAPEGHPESTPEPPARRRSRRKDQNQIELFGQESSTAHSVAPVVTVSGSEGDEQVSNPDSSPPDLEESLAETGWVEPSNEPEAEQEEKSAGETTVAPRKAVARRPVDLAGLRQAVHEILPLLGDRDPGAKDCFKANRSAFRSAFLPAGFDEFEQLIKAGTFDTALEMLTKLARKHGIHV